MEHDAMDMGPGQSTAVVVYEQAWARRLTGVIRSTGGEMALHVQVPRDALEAAVAAAIG